LFKNETEFRQDAPQLAPCDETGFSGSRPAGPLFERKDQRERDPGRLNYPECNTNPPAARLKAPGERLD
jgi:hypothetical protein